MVCLVVNGKKLPKAERLIEKLIQIEGMTSITISPNTRRDNVIMGDSYEILWGQGYITDYIGNVKISDFSIIILSGESGTDRETIRTCT